MYIYISIYVYISCIMYGGSKVVSVVIIENIGSLINEAYERIYIR